MSFKNPFNSSPQKNEKEKEDERLENVKNLYEKRVGYYDALSETAKRRDSFRKFFEQSDYLPQAGANVLDAGCGTGMITQTLVEILDKKDIKDVKFYGFDLTPAMLGKFDKWAKNNRKDIQLHEANVLELKQDLPKDWNNFDLIVSANMLEHIPKEKLSQALLNLKSLLSEDGKLIVFIEEASFLNKTLVKLYWKSENYTKDQLHQIFLEAGFKAPKIERFGNKIFKCFAVVTEPENH